MSIGMETTVIVGAAGSGCWPHRSLSVHLHLNCETDRLGPLPFDKFLARQNREFRVVTHPLAIRRPCAGRTSAISPLSRPKIPCPVSAPSTSFSHRLAQAPSSICFSDFAPGADPA